MKVRRNKLLYKYMLTYIIMTSLIIILMTPIYCVTIKSVRENAVELLSHNVNSVSKQLSSSIEALLQLDQTMISVAYSRVKVTDCRSFGTARIYDLVEIREQFMHLTRNIDFFASCYMVFHRNSRVIVATPMSGSFIHVDSGHFFSSFMHYTALEGNIDLLLRNNTKPLSIIPATPIYGNYYGVWTEKDALTVVVQTPSNMVSICGVLSTGKLLERYGMNTLPTESYFVLRGRDDTVLFANNGTDEGKAGYTAISATIPILEGELIIGIPDSYFAEKTVYVRDLIMQYIFIAFAIGVLLAIFLSIYSYIPIYRLVRLSEKYMVDKSPERDVFAYLRWVTEQSAAINKNLRGALDVVEDAIRENTLRNLALGVPTDKTTAKSLLPVLHHNCRLGMIETSGDKDDAEAEQIAIAVDMLMRDEKYLIAHISPTVFVVLITEEDLSRFEASIENLRAMLIDEYESRPIVVISSEFSGYGGVRDAFLQIRLASVYADDKNTMICKSGSKLLDPYAFADPHKLAAYIRSGQEENIRSMIKEALSSLIDAGASFDDVRNLYYLLSAAPSMVLSEAKGEGSEKHIIPVFNPNQSVLEQFDVLVENCINIAQKKVADRSASDSYKVKLIQYLDDNFADPDMYAGMLAEKFSISTKQVYRIVREHTGAGFSDYLNRLRMNQAAKLLLETDLPIAEIALKSGYTNVNTFYKSFKRTYGCTPGQYRG